MAIVARGKVEGANAETYSFGNHADYVLAEEDGYDLIYLLRAASVDLAPYEAALVEVRGEVVGTEPSGRFEIFSVESVNEIGKPGQR